jgi:Ca2+-binding RTX toxin-like protein
MLINSTEMARHDVLVTDALFGANFLFNRDRIDGGTYDSAADRLGVTSLRYPGGTIAEQFFDVTNPNRQSIDLANGQTVNLTPLDDFFSYAFAENRPVSIVVPTRTALTDGDLGSRSVSDAAVEEVRTFVRDLLEGRFGDAEIDVIELGNEYWLGGQMTAREYGSVASAFAAAIQSEIDAFIASGRAPAGWEEPRIAVQIGQEGRFSPGDGLAQNRAIMEQFTTEEANAVDAVIGHLYARHNAQAIDDGTYGWFFNRLESWQRNPRFGADIDILVTEWNIKNEFTSVAGLMRAPILVSLFIEFIENGVDAAWVWPLQQNTRNDLAGNEGNPRESFSGETFRMLAQNTNGATYLGRVEQNGVFIYVFEENGRKTLLVSSTVSTRQDVTVDLSSFGMRISGASVTEMRSADGNFADDESQVIVSTSRRTVTNDSLFLTLEPFQLTSVTHFAASDTIDVTITRIVGTADANVMTSPIFGAEILAGAGDDTIGGDAGRDTIHGEIGADSIMGGRGSDLLFGGEGDDSIFGEAGNDRIEGGDGADRMNGGDGNDTINAGAGDDAIWGGAGDDSMDGGSGNDTLGGGHGADTILGDDGSDRIVGANGQDQVFGGNGNDTISGGIGGDTLLGEGGNDVLIGGLNMDRLDGGDGDDTIRGDQHDDRLFGGSGNDSLAGGDGIDHVFGGYGDDHIRGDIGADILWGDDGADTILGGEGSDRIGGGAGNDRILGDTGNDTINGGQGHDLLSGGFGDDILMGSVGNDMLYGDAGDDRLLGGVGRDVFFGGSGADTFVFELAPRSQRDHVMDFEQGVDRLQFLGFSSGFEGLVIRDTSTGVEVRAGNTFVMLIDEVAMQMDRTDFLFG